MTNAILAQKNIITKTKWAVAANLPALNGAEKSLGFAGPVVGLSNGVMIIAGGANFPNLMPWQGGKKVYYNDAYVFERKGKDISLKNTTNLPFNIAYAACCSTTQGLFFAGGENENGICNKVFLLIWDKLANALVPKELPKFPIYITNASATFFDNIVYVVGGETNTGVSNKIFALDLNQTSLGWNQLSDLPKPISHSVMLVQSNASDGSIYVVGGRKKNSTGISDLYNSVFELNLKQNKWVEKAALPYSLSAGTGIALGTKKILIFGGDNGATFHQVETMLVAIANEKDSLKKQAIIEQKNKLQAAHPGFSKQILQYDIIRNEWTVLGTIPFDVPVTTTAIDWDGDIFIPSGEIRAGVRSPKILVVTIQDK